MICWILFLIFILVVHTHTVSLSSFVKTERGGQDRNVQQTANRQTEPHALETIGLAWKGSNKRWKAREGNKRDILDPAEPSTHGISKH